MVSHFDIAFGPHFLADLGLGFEIESNCEVGSKLDHKLKPEDKYAFESDLESGLDLRIDCNE